MAELREKAAYMRGILEGINFNGDDQQKKLWETLIDFCDGVAEDLNELEGSHNEFADYIEAIDEDLRALEKYFYDNNDEDEDENQEVIFTSDPTPEVRKMDCPYCSQGVYFEVEPGEYEVICPECGKVIWSNMNEETVPANRSADVI